MSCLIIIPARYESSRFPGKPLELIAGKSLIQRVYEQCDKSNADDIIVATDDQRIFDHVREFDGNVCMTSSSNTNGTERIAEALERIMDDGDEYDIIINVQGDEPLVDPEDLNRIMDMMEDDESDIGTMVTPIESWDDVDNPNVVKVVTSLFEEGVADALYFSRNSIPYIVDQKDRMSSKPMGFYRHIGIYAFQTEALTSLKTVPATDLEISEKLEQLRWLQNHYVVSVIETKNKAIGVDVPSDISIVENILKSKS
jgi:3-deoxy-manno-octulosonate cytidylyltransferase (CMP-KDO synthetase)